MLDAPTEFMTALARDAESSVSILSRHLDTLERAEDDEESSASLLLVLHTRTHYDAARVRERVQEHALRQLALL